MRGIGSALVLVVSLAGALALIDHTSTEAAQGGANASATAQRTTPKASTQHPDTYVDTGYQEFNMHACPQGYAMRGYHEERNLLLCERVAAAGTEAATITSTVRDTGQTEMGCPSGQYVRGIHRADGKVICSQNKGRQVEGTVDNSGQNDANQYKETGIAGVHMHACPNGEDKSRKGVITSINTGSNVFKCGYLNELK